MSSHNNKRNFQKAVVRETSSRAKWDDSSLKIDVIYSDESIIVVDKPGNLRSVPGHAAGAPEVNHGHPRKRSRRSHDIGNDNSNDIGNDNSNVIGNDNSNGNDKPQTLPKKSPQDAWAAAIRELAARHDKSNSSVQTAPLPAGVDQRSVKFLLQNLAESRHLESLPRSGKTFVRYCLRNRLRLFSDVSSDSSSDALGDTAKVVHDLIRKEQCQLLQVPPPTEDAESALGQLRLLGYEPDRVLNPIRVVHRLDCETSGVMVFARTNEAATKLCHAWRIKHDSQNQNHVTTTNTTQHDTPSKPNSTVEKHYLAQVHSWPPFDPSKETPTMSGVIDVALASSPTERIKWQVVEPQDGGKKSLTHWKVLTHQQALELFPREEKPNNEKVVINDEGKHQYKSTDDPKTQNRQDHSTDAKLNSDKQRIAEKSKTLPVHHQDSNPKSSSSPLFLWLQPFTGRTHQLRIHCAHVGNGILGDSLYGKDAVLTTTADSEERGGLEDATRRRKPVLSVLRLHAYSLSFPHPKSNTQVTFSSPKKPLWL